MSLGNEVNLYLESHSTETAAYQTFYSTGAAVVKALAPSALTSITFTANIFTADLTTSTGTALVALRNAVDFFSITYYPLESDYTVRSSTYVDVQFPQMAAVAAASVPQRKILFQEVGYPSGAANLSSQAKQAAFYGKVFDQLEADPSDFDSAPISMMLADLSTAAATAQATYYNNTDPVAISYLQTIGMVDVNGVQKAGWRGPSPSGPSPCRDGSIFCGSTKIVAYPNPWDARQHAGLPMRLRGPAVLRHARRLHAVGRTPGAAGHPVRRGRLGPEGTRPSGPAATGVYVAAAKGPDGSVRRALFAVQR